MEELCQFLERAPSNPRETPSMPSRSDTMTSTRPNSAGSKSQASYNANLTEGNASDGPPPKKRKVLVTTAQNDTELRKLIRQNQNKSIEEMAKEVILHDGGAKSEKSKQIFAMLWLSKVCQKKSNHSVPRSRVYSSYASRCGDEHVSPLNPASFGKLVRIIFPGVQTRRLGVRGESKYHYVDLWLEDDDPSSSTQYGARSKEAPVRSGEFSHIIADTAVFPSPGTTTTPVSDPNFVNLSDDNRPVSRHKQGLHVNPNITRQYLGDQSPNILSRPLRFYELQEPEDGDRIELPDIRKYLPPNTDPDLSGALSALYRTHCISLIDTFRFCKGKMFFHHFASFQGTLTLPVQKLLADQSLALWVKECDWLTYQKMMCLAAPLTTQVVPPPVVDIMTLISSSLVSHIETTFRNLPPHVVLAKVIPATMFTSLLKRLLRVNATAHAAANILLNPASRRQMWEDWNSNVDVELVLESSVPVSGFHGTRDIMKNEVQILLSPLGDYPSSSNHGSGSDAFPERWVDLLSSLPARFPCVADEPDRLVSFHASVWQAALRDLTLKESPSFGSWWVAKTFLDEMLLWMIESGGFMSHRPASAQGNEDGVKFLKTIDVVPFPKEALMPRTTGKDGPVTSERSEDSGIGMATEEDMLKFVDC